jgi:hypothetical protein
VVELDEAGRAVDADFGDAGFAIDDFQMLFDLDEVFG